MSAPRPKVHKKIVEALDATGLPWTVEGGSSHWKLRLGGRLAGVVPRGSVKEIPGRAVENTIRQIQRLAREIVQ